MGNQQTYRVRTQTELEEALQRFVDHAWQKPTGPLFHIPVDEAQDADCILSDGIKELMMLRKATAADSEATITDERLQEIEQQARGIFLPPPNGYQAGNGQAVMAVIEEGKKKALAAVPGLVAEIHRLRAKVAEQENTIAGLRTQLATTALLFPTTACTYCGRTAKDLPEGFSLIGKMGVMGNYSGPHFCWPNCPPKAPTDSNQREGDAP